MFYISISIAICVSILTVCANRAVEATPIWAVVLLVLSSFTFGFILGENRE